MSELVENILGAISHDRYVFGAHADQRMRERRIMGWQIIAGAAVARVIAEHGEAEPNPTVEFEQFLPDGTPVKVVWAWISDADTAKLVTVHFFDR